MFSINVKRNRIGAKANGFPFLAAAFTLLIFTIFSAIPVSATQTDIAGPAGSGTFGGTVTVLPNGNFVVVDSKFDLSGPVTDVGAVYLYNGATLAVISTLTGTTALDQVGSTGITVLTNGNFVVRSQLWDNTSPAVLDVGAVTWCSSATGCNGAVSAANSLIGGTASDTVGIGNGSVTALTNGNYVVTSPFWDNPSLAVDVGAVTWGNGTTGTSGLVTAANSLIGGTTTDNVGNGGVIALTNGNYVVRTTAWDNPSPTVIVDVGAVTWGNGTTGTSGLVTAANSLIGGTLTDNVGSSGVTALTNGNYVVRSRNWDNPSPLTTNVGAVTWGNGTTGTSGLVTAANSLIGGTASDSVGSSGVTALTNGNYVVRSQNWDNPSPLIADVGAVTWGNGTTGISGLVTAANSLVGGTSGDTVGGSGVTALTNGNYVVTSPFWDNPSLAVDVGAVTWGNGTTGTSGLVTAANSLIGGTASDFVGFSGVTALTNGNYVVGSNNWDNPSPATANVGAVTWGNGTTGTSGLVTAANSLIGGTATDNVGGSGVTALTNGNYVVGSSSWDNPSPATAFVGAVTWGNGTTGTSGLVTAANSLIGGTLGDSVGTGITALTNGNYVVRSTGWDNPSLGASNNAGAVTWGNGTTGTSGVVTAANSLIGGTASDNVGSSGVTALTNGNYVVQSNNWDNPSPVIANARAITYGRGTGGTTGLITTANSVPGGIASGISGFSFDALRNRLFVGRGASNFVSILFFNTNATSDGAFSTAGIWDSGVPDSYTNGVIPDGRTVTLDSAATVGLVSVGCTGAFAGASATNYINGSVQKDYCAATNETFNYPVGDAANYSPMSVANLSGTGSLLAKVTDATLPGLDTGQSASRFWTLSGSGITTNLSFTYIDGDINGSEAGYLVYKRSAGLTTQITPFSSNPATNTVTATGVSSFSDWGPGIIAAPTGSGVTISGFVQAPDNGLGGRKTTLRGIAATITLTDFNGNTYTTRTNPKDGSYQIDELPIPEFYTVNITARGYYFPPRTLDLFGGMTNLNFLAEGGFNAPVLAQRGSGQ